MKHIVFLLREGNHIVNILSDEDAKNISEVALKAIQEGTDLTMETVLPDGKKELKTYVGAKCLMAFYITDALPSPGERMAKAMEKHVSEGSEWRDGSVD